MYKRQASHRSQHLNFNDPEPEINIEQEEDSASSKHPFRFSAFDSRDALYDDFNYDRTTDEPHEPPDTHSDPPTPEPPEDHDPETARAPLDPGLRQDEPPGPPRTRAAAKVPGQELPTLPGIAHDRLPIERALKKKKGNQSGKQIIFQIFVF